MAAEAPAKLLYVIGAQKAGTSWLHSYLQDHPECHVPAFKEAHYWDDFNPDDPIKFLAVRLRELSAKIEKDRKTIKNIPAYLDRISDVTRAIGMFSAKDHSAYKGFLLHGYQGEPLVADITPGYATVNKAVFKQMSDVADDTKFVFILRDPVDRLWSAIRMYYEVKTAKTGESLDAFLRVFDRKIPKRYMGRCDYRRTIKELEAVVPKKRIHYMFYENLMTQEGIQTFTDFAGLSSHAPDFDKRVREGVSQKMPEAFGAILHERLNRQYTFITRRFGDQVPTKWRKPLVEAGAA